MPLSSWIGLALLSARFFLSAEALPAANAGDAACTSLLSTLGTQIVQTAGTGLQDSIDSPLNLVNNALVPTCVVLPTSTADVSAAMAAIYSAKARYAVLAGGHSAMKGWNAVQGGVLIDFKNMKDASYDAQRDTITLQPGIRWGETIAALAPQGVAPVGGRATHVGGGFLLGGGISFLSPAVGWGADMFREVDVVLVNGTVVTATANNEYSDLFKALKGGGNRFGIVTRYEYPESSTEAVIRATARYTREVKDPNGTIFVAVVEQVVDGAITRVVRVNLFYHDTELPESIFGELLSIPSSESFIKPMSYADIVLETYPNEDAHGTTYIYGSSVFAGTDEDAFVNAIQANLDFTNLHKDQLSNTALTYTPIPDSQILAGRQRGGNAIDAPVTGGYAVIQIMQTLSPGVVEPPSAILESKKQLLQQIKPTPGLPLFLNECDAHQNIFATYGQYEFLKQTYAKYDPERFNVQFTDGPIGL
ncbi:fad binding domain-containing protein [Moniliophthora roreri]|uniref:FAD-binding PCMH-type domain-containing protein n=1 Tax=Moniliophthora roreri TaxID=221103 RepID=A0A0W0G7G0_MONRR|nr:fad binding domain-containing protein [Moniliophthora roreri]